MNYTSTLTSYHWKNEGAKYNGYLLDFIVKFSEVNIDEPENYSLDKIHEIEQRYTISENTDAPHIIVIMDEAFSDFSVINDKIETNKSVTPYISSLKEDTISGYALASVFGGNTANSEYEFLTGNSMAWFPQGTIPYQQYIKAPAYSMVSYLKAYNDQYQCIAMHPYDASGWSRPSTYHYFGFEECLFIEDFPQQDCVRNYISDKEMFEKVIEVYKEKKAEPLFLFGVTMQNHGNYQYENFENTITLEKTERQYSDVEQYLSIVNETDKAVKDLIEYFKSVEEDVVIAFFGDHMPGVDEEFYTYINGGEYDNLDEIQNRYKVPFFVWTNYDIDEQYVECTSLNYLSNYVYEVAGIPMPRYNQFLKDMQNVVPAMNMQGFYSYEKECYLNYDQAEGREKEILDEYKQLQYNSLFDIKNRSAEIFPVYEKEELQRRIN